MPKLGHLIAKMTQYYRGDPHQIEHFLKVYGYAVAIADGEQLPPLTCEVLYTAAVLHDVGCKVSVQKYGSSAGPHQEKEGPPIARSMLQELGYKEPLIQRVCYLIGHHHTYRGIDGDDYQVLVEADFLTNIGESEQYYRSRYTALENIFRTPTGIHLFGQLYT